MQRPQFRDLFLSVERRPEVHFYTSNVDKFLQARVVFQRSGLPYLRHFGTHTEPYSEDYSQGKERLLNGAISQIVKTVGQGNLVFVEDTSLRLQAFSDEDVDFPGLRVKEWFSETTFEQTDELLKACGNDRRAIVSSDIALHVPGLGRPLYFHGQTSGVVAASPPTFAQSVQHPWLTPSTFNGWIIPDGASKRLGEMSLEESWSYDFRVRALSSLIERLEEITAGLNLPRTAYAKRQSPVPSGQLFLMPQIRPVILVIGKTCSGKSTFGERCAGEANFQWFEASDIVRSLIGERMSGVSAESMPDLARRLLTDSGFDIVARKVSHYLEAEPDLPSVVTGFRTLEELEYFKRRFPEALVVLLESTERTRFERYLARARPGSATNIAQFVSRDRDQWDFGLLAVAEDFADLRITNEGTLTEFFQQIDSVINRTIDIHITGVSANIHSVRKSDSSQLVRCLEALAVFGRPADCNEISESTSESGRAIRFNNVNKILKRYPQLSQRMDVPGEKVLYRITDGGRTYLRLLRDLRRSGGLAERMA